MVFTSCAIHDGNIDWEIAFSHQNRSFANSCRRREYVAVKVVRRVKRYVEDAMVEVGILDQLGARISHSSFNTPSPTLSSRTFPARRAMQGIKALLRSALQALSLQVRNRPARISRGEGRISRRVGSFGPFPAPMRPCRVQSALSNASGILSWSCHPKGN